jgi:hypothetical protein
MSQHLPSPDEALDRARRPHGVAGEPLHAGGQLRVTVVTDGPQHLCLLRPCGVPARGLVGENPGGLDLGAGAVHSDLRCSPSVGDALTITAAANHRPVRAGAASSLRKVRTSADRDFPKSPSTRPGGHCPPTGTTSALVYVALVGKRPRRTRKVVTTRSQRITPAMPADPDP